jgi:ABC-type nitrate/sulfonate/bicarbonate transport system ATPase subunit
MADRVLVLAEGKFIAERHITLPRKRHAGTAEFVALRQYFLNKLGVETEG